MSDKTLGQVAEDAFSEALDTVSESKTGAEAKAIGDKAWQAAAEAVAKRVEGPCYPKERDVIEAAEALIQCVHESNRLELDLPTMAEAAALRLLGLRVRALQEARDE